MVNIPRMVVKEYADASDRSSKNGGNAGRDLTTSDNRRRLASYTAPGISGAESGATVSDKGRGLAG